VAVLLEVLIQHQELAAQVVVVVAGPMVLLAEQVIHQVLVQVRVILAVLDFWGRWRLHRVAAVAGLVVRVQTALLLPVVLAE
jgi:hypothetical protein